MSLPDVGADKSSRPSLFLVVVIVLSLTGSYLELSKSNTSCRSRKHTQIANSVRLHWHTDMLNDLEGKTLTVLPSSSLLVGWDHYYWLADGPGGQRCRLYLWLCVCVSPVMSCVQACSQGQAEWVMNIQWQDQRWLSEIQALRPHWRFG